MTPLTFRNLGQSKAQSILRTLVTIGFGVGLAMGTVGCSPSYSRSPVVESLPLTAQVTIGSETILLEVATTPTQQAQGLMFRTELAGDRGMLFTFPEPRIARFWMKNTLIPLDMIFLRDGQIKQIIPNVPPCKADPCPNYGPLGQEVNQVLELKAGRAQELGLEVNQVLEFLPLSGDVPVK
ncbi:DUF192 domain-containing protein [Synechocystis salina]|uniref:DUF192 domain-containing protein n=1 Tax=Synechocystis salina LEGE 00031 TaxID=1828736 RepID=A0ABR9VNW0_9SYNC|nr:DUF192 domain-containing protein [Synechocystis salina]MBE9239891.1 DUF192 domain-containing protein [Synechocystis salina LEGE 00041]MBE9253025.1 DUF192 domain-containing protein [Synechocystis salina LEGE 00031]